MAWVRVILAIPLLLVSVAQGGNIKTVAGGGPDNVPALSANLQSPISLAFDSTGNLFIVSLGLHSVFKMDATTGILTRVAGNGFPGFNGDGGPAVSASLRSPTGVAIDSFDNLYIADFRNHRIRRVDAATGIITTAVGDGSFGVSGDGGPATDASLNDARAVAVDSADNLYIADSLNHRIRKVDALGIITTVVGDGSSGFSGDGGPATDAGLNNPVGLAVDSADNLYIADLEDFGFGRIRKVDAATGIITTVAGGEGSGGDGGPATDASLRNPFGVTLDSADNLYIAEFAERCCSSEGSFVSGNRVRKVDAATGIITTVAGREGLNNAEEGFGFFGDAGLAINASLANPFGVALDSADNLYIADMSNNRIRKVGTAFGFITTVAGNGSPDISGDGAPAISGSLADPRGVALDSADNLYIADFSSHQIRKVDAATGIITTVAGNGSSGFNGDGDLATSASLSSPTGVALDSDDNLYIADLNNQRIRRVDAASGNITTVAGDGSLGFSGDGGPATSASLANPTGVALDSFNNLYIADFSNSRIRKVDVATGDITTVAGNGIAGFSGDGGPATSASLANPTGVALDGSNNLYIADLNNQRIRKVDVATGNITTVAGDGVPGFSGDGGPATSASLRSPFGVALDSADNLYIADLNTQRIRKVDAATGVITTVAGDGTFGFSGDGGPAIGASLRSATGVALDSADNLYIADSNNQRIRKIEFLAAQARNKSILETYGQIPLYFEANQGQADSQVRFLSRGRGYSLFLTPSEAVLTLEKPVEAGNEQPVTRTRLKDHESRLGIQTETVHMRLGGANLHPRITGLKESGKVNYFIGNDPKNWRTGIPTFKKVRYKDVYPGVDLIYYGNQGKLEYDFVVAPGTDPQIIRLRFEGLNSPLQVDSEGDLVLLESGGGDLRLQKPIIYQEIGGRRRQIAGGYSPQNDDSVGFELGVYDPSKTLIIDPVLEYSTRLGDRVEGIAVDDAGNAYLTGSTEFIPFTVGLSGSDGSVFVAKLDSTGSELLYFTIIASSFDPFRFGGPTTVSQSIAVDGAGNAYVTGFTSTTTLPTVNALQPAHAGGPLQQSRLPADAFVLKLDPTGSALIYSTYLGGSGNDSGKGIAVDDAGNTYLTGSTSSTDFPIADARQPALSGGFDAFVAKLDSTGSALIYSTYLGGSESDDGTGIAVDDAGNAYLTGGTDSADFPITANAFQPFIQGVGDAFVAKLDSTGSALIYSTYLGGSGEDSAAGIAVDDAGNAYLVGNTSSVDFPITANALQPSFAGVFSDATVTKLDPTGSALIYSTYLGGTGEDQGSGIAVDGFGRAFVTGQSSPSAFIGAAFGTFVAKLNSTGSGLVFLTSLVTGAGQGLHSLRLSQPGIAVDDAGNAYVTGTTDSRDFPRVNALPPDFEGFRGEGAFVAKIIDKRTEIGVFRNGGWSLDFNGNGQWDGCENDQCIPFGLAGDLPVTGDWDGSGTTKIGVFRNGGWSLDFNGNGQWDGCGIDQCIPFGLAGDLPVTGDWDGSGTTKIGVVRTGGWSLDFNGNGQWDGCGIDQCFPFGLTGDLPVTGDWDGSGTTDIGVVQDGRWALDSTGSGQSDDCTTVECIPFGLTGDLPVIGQWR